MTDRTQAQDILEKRGARAVAEAGRLWEEVRARGIEDPAELVAALVCAAFPPALRSLEEMEEVFGSRALTTWLSRVAAVHAGLRRSSALMDMMRRDPVGWAQETVSQISQQVLQDLPEEGES